MSQSTDGNRRTWLLLLGCALFLGISLWLGQALLQQHNDDQRLFSPNSCDPEQLQQGCSARNGTQQIDFFIDATQINSQAPVAFRVSLQGFTPQQVEIELQGRDMYMGQLRVTLERDSDGQYRTQSSLPACSSGAMTWRARIWITEAAGLSGSWFDFTAR